MMRTAAFIDRDGIVNHLIDRGENMIVAGKKVRYTAPWRFSEYVQYESVADALDLLHKAGYLCVLTTNQPDIAYGTLSLEEHERIMHEVKKLPFDDIFVCPHGRTEGCDCKKPKPGLLLQAAEKWNVDLAMSYMIGDSESDIEAGHAAGCTTILVSNEGTGTDIEPEYRTNTLRDAAEYIISRI